MRGAVVDYISKVCSRGDRGINNDLNVLVVSPLMRGILRGVFRYKLEGIYKITEDGLERREFYFLGDGIYPQLATV